MSMVSLLNATKTAVQSMLGLTAGIEADDVCDITDDGSPKPSSGQVFYGIVGNSFSNTYDLGLDETYDFEIIITLRAGYSPEDRTGSELLLKPQTVNQPNTGGLWARVEALRAHLHMNDLLRIDANTNATYGIGNAANGFVVPPVFLGAQYLGAKSPDWFSAEGADDAITGVAAKLTFGRAERVQTIESET